MAGQGRAGLLRWSSAKKKRPVWFATHQGFLGNRERAQRVTGASESMKNPHGGTVHCSGKNGNAAISAGFSGEGVAWGHEGGCPP
jgi:hypothetical protein